MLGVPEHMKVKEGGVQEEGDGLPGSGANESCTPRPGVGHGAHEEEECVPGSDAHALQDPALVTCVTLSNLAF